MSGKPAAAPHSSPTSPDRSDRRIVGIAPAIGIEIPALGIAQVVPILSLRLRKMAPPVPFLSVNFHVLLVPHQDDGSKYHGLRNREQPAEGSSGCIRSEEQQAKYSQQKGR